MTTLTSSLKKVAVSHDNAALQQLIAQLPLAELVDAICTLTIWQQRAILTLLSLPQRALVFKAIPASRRYDIARSMDCSALAALLSTMDSQQRASMQRLLPRKQRDRLAQQSI
ncbi:hypothetical protein Q3O59_12155 [Alkalimonas delamerensis]|uniref:Magnesium transporter MgtE intracellular domain-containing protein n=1 Tax=Alkalimonas delamerensis TaxID=265981 RepID=A0ABT9GS17_9GAMM|nr:hypothetical protein [Alkalimonas delamerensis]MDP4529776.1 hypothetical protein [Alkalimonas delamerensis]